jgi:hypothetical protein
VDINGTPDDVEAHLVATAEALTAAGPGECVFCYVDRMLSAFGCDTTLRWARRWRDLTHPRATGLERRLGRRGGFCDCEIFLNGWDLADATPGEDGVPDWPAVRPPCAGGRASQPCANWVPRRRDRW